MRIIPTKIANIIYPKDLPNGLFTSLIIACLLLGLASLRHGTDFQGWLNVIEHWLLMLLIFPTATATVATGVCTHNASSASCAPAAAGGCSAHWLVPCVLY